MSIENEELRMQNIATTIAADPEAFGVGYRFGEDMFKSATPGNHLSVIRALREVSRPAMDIGVLLGYFVTERTVQ